MNNLAQPMFAETLRRELIPAMGCTEPIAIAYAAAKAREELPEEPLRMEVRCSGNIIKNVKGVTVPNSGGMKGIEVAAILGVLGGNAERQLEVLEEVTPEQQEKARLLAQTDFCRCSLADGVENLYVSATLYSAHHSACVVIINRHTLITDITVDGKTKYHYDPMEQHTAMDWDAWSIRSIVDYAEHADLSEIQDVLEQQIEMNTRISREGLSRPYGAQVGLNLLETYGDTVQTRARAAAAAGSDARMGGCSLPVVINSGSGNQGMTVSLPLIEYAADRNIPKEKLYRALIISNLVSIFQKHFIGSLSAFCGAVTAASGCGAALTWLLGGSYEAICRTIINTLADVGGIVCDGAKSSCAAKIASALDAAILASHMSVNGCVYQNGEGIVQDDIEKTIRSIGYVGKVGMRETDKTILEIMLNHVPLDPGAPQS